VKYEGNISLKVSYSIPIWPAGIMKILLSFQCEIYYQAANQNLAHMALIPPVCSNNIFEDYEEFTCCFLRLGSQMQRFS